MGVLNTQQDSLYTHKYRLLLQMYIFKNKGLAFPAVASQAIYMP